MFASGWKERKIERAFTREDKGIDMVSNNKKLIAVIGATGQQGGGVVWEGRYRLVKEITVDPHSPVLLVHTRLEVMNPTLRGESKI